MRISDWSSDVCSSDLRLAVLRFDLLIVDGMMPGESGLALTSALRRDSTVPILMLTAMAEPDDRIDGLERGADDYLAKPFEPRELPARIRSVMRRAAPPAPAQVAPIAFGPFPYAIPRPTLAGPGGQARPEERRAGEEGVRKC